MFPNDLQLNFSPGRPLRRVSVLLRVSVLHRSLIWGAVLLWLAPRLKALVVHPIYHLVRGVLLSQQAALFEGSLKDHYFPRYPFALLAKTACFTRVRKEVSYRELATRPFCMVWIMSSKHTHDAGEERFKWANTRTVIS